MAENKANFRINRIEKIKDLYSDEVSTRRRLNQSIGSSEMPKNAAKVRELLEKAITDRTQVVKLSKELYAKNPIYASVINYLSNMYMWRYTVTPHKTYKKSKAKDNKKLPREDYMLMYHHMLEVVDGLSIETKFPSILTLLFTSGAVYLTTYCDEDSITIDSLLLPDKYCRKIGETQYGSAIIQFDFSYFQDLGLTKDQLNEYFKSFPKEFKTKYLKYQKNPNDRWQTLDPHYSTGILLNDYSIPTYFYLLGGLLDYEQYQDNELERNGNLLKYLVVQTMPIYQDKLIFEMDEVNALHKSLRKVIDKGEKTKLITTFGDVKLLKVAENDTVANEVLVKAFKAIFNNAGFNSAIFTAESVEALKMSLIRDKGMVWRYVSALLNFYTIAINNWFDFKGYEADIDILPISPYTYDDDIQVYKENATLGVGKLNYIVASGIKQRDIEGCFELETFLKLDQITPMQTSYTQTAVDREKENVKDNGKEDESNPSDIEPSDKEKKKPSTDEE